MKNKGGIVIIGAGIGGLATALRLAPMPVTLVAGAPMGQNNSSSWAQGGIAAALGKGDSAEAHAEDTIAAGGGLVDRARALHLARNGKRQIDWLTELGAPFDRDDQGNPVLGREAAHRVNRIVHADGDGTGAVVMNTLIRHARATPSIDFLPGWQALDLDVAEGRARAVILAGPKKFARLPCTAIVLATGGLGQLFSCTTNPPAACGDGLAMAVRAGARLADLEFVQFHPTALATGRDPLPLLTEALRGDGAALVNAEGERFMEGEHAQAELAPRDVVARAIWRQLQEGRKPALDTREIFRKKRNRFPLIRAICVEAGFDPAQDLLPVAPAAHYAMGGVAVDEKGRGSLDGLYACGEVACTFVHGANRLASNSLLEALVYAEAIAADLAQDGAGAPAGLEDCPGLSQGMEAGKEPILRAQLRQLMYDRLGLVRDEEGMREALRQLAGFAGAIPPRTPLAAHVLVASMIALSALRRPESRGAHFRLDHPKPEEEARHSFYTLDSFRAAAAGELGRPWPGAGI